MVHWLTYNGAKKPLREAWLVEGDKVFHFTARVLAVDKEEADAIPAYAKAFILRRHILQK